ncbi:MAG: class I SAM-dependent methyltransferase [Methanomassiliicoccales archaeon]|jgi:tRNA (cmo5U34)-methyltransferase
MNRGDDKDGANGPIPKAATWSDNTFADLYVDTASMIIVDRLRMIELAKKFHSRFIGKGKEAKVLDLGCGEGTFAYALKEEDPSISVTLLDGSKGMLDKARERFGGSEDVKYVNRSFEDMLGKDIGLGRFDLVISSMALHHLTRKDKKRMFKIILEHLEEGGWFMNIDAVLPETASLEDWYISLWEEHVLAEKGRMQVDFDHNAIIYGHHQAADHHANLDPLEHQLAWLRLVGFKSVDVVMKNGIFSIFCGQKPRKGA